MMQICLLYFIILVCMRMHIKKEKCLQFAFQSLLPNQILDAFISHKFLCTLNLHPHFQYYSFHVLLVVVKHLIIFRSLSTLVASTKVNFDSSLNVHGNIKRNLTVTFCSHGIDAMESVWRLDREIDRNV